MHAVVVQFDLHPESADAFISRAIANKEQSLARESGCHQFHICRNPDRPEMVMFYELFESTDAFQYHQVSVHNLEFSNSVRNMVTFESVTHYDQVWN